MPLHILISRTDNIGDVVLTLPMVARLKEINPDSRITFLCREYVSPLVKMSRLVDDVVELEKIVDDPVSYFKQAGIDVVIFAQPDKQLAWAAFKAGIPHRIGNARHKIFNMLTCNRRVFFRKGSSDSHEAQQNFEFLRHFGCLEIPDISSLSGDYNFRVPHIAEVEKIIAPQKFNVILHTKSNGHGREWPIGHYLRLAQELHSSDESIQIWLTGSQAEGKWIEVNCPELLRLPHVGNLCGRFSLEQLIVFINASDGLIASGTGPLHISAALGQRTLGLFPPKRPMHPGRWAPVGLKAQYLSAETACTDCPDVAGGACDCMRKILPSVVAKIVGQWLDDKKISDRSKLATNLHGGSDAQSMAK